MMMMMMVYCSKVNAVTSAAAAAAAVCMHSSIVVINVRKKIKKTLINAFFMKKIKNVCKRNKNVTLFSPVFDALTKSLTLTIW